MNRFITAVLLILCNISLAQNVNSLWKSASRNSDSKSINKTKLPLKHLFDLDTKVLKSKLATSPKRDYSKTKSNTIISLPNGDGKLENFRVYENAVMAPELAAKYPEIKSYVAIGIDNPAARAYFSNSPLGFKSMTLYADDVAVFIEPISADLKTYTAYKKSDKKTAADPFECNTIEQANNTKKIKKNSTVARNAADDGKLRTFRLALSCTAEYAAYFGGTKALALAGMNNTLTRINGVFEKDFGLQLILVTNNDKLIYTDPATDPYSDASSKSNWRSEIQSNLNTTIGLANYDLGHLLGAGTGNCGDAGGIGTICSDYNKGSGYTCAYSGAYQGDAFDIEYVAHEMGHQLGAYHTFTYKSEAGTGAQMEPGDGSTIMSYGGLSMKAFQDNPDAYFHAISIQQVTDNIKSKTCSVQISTGNAVPVVNAGLDYSIPKGTPFMLKGSATDSNTDDILTYSWEQMDLGNATYSIPNAASTIGPLFRSYPPNSSSTRYFPNMTTILAGLTTTQGTYIPSEALPSVARTLNFRLTVRDNKAGGAANNTDDVIVTVDENSGPFTVDSQNSAISYAAGTTQTINWIVAGTNANGVNCATVDILLSTDGGKTFTITLLSGTLNNGSATVVIPNIPGTTNRIMVKGTNQIFFDVNNVNFTISGSGAADTIAPTASTLSTSGTTQSSTELSWTAAIDNVGVSGYDVYQNGVLKTTTSATSLAVDGLSASTVYSFYIVAKDAAGNLSAASNTVTTTTLTEQDMTAPTTSTLSVSGTTTSSTNLSWTAATDNVGVSAYNVYQNGVLKTTTSATSLAVSGISASTAYSFYVVAKDAAGNLSAASNTVNANTLADIGTTTLTKITLAYCSSYGTSTAKEYINKVQIGTINNLSGNNNGSGNFTSISTDLAIGSSNTIVITPAWKGSPVNESYSVWIDFNQDGDFNDNGELVLSKAKTKAKLVSANITIPTTVTLGATRMRISMKNNTQPNSCEIFSYGEVEDYTVTITGSTAKLVDNEPAAVNRKVSALVGPKLSFKLYPNPVRGDLLNISNLEKSSDYRIFNMTGQELQRNHIENNTIYVGTLSRGTYLIEIKDDTSTTTKQFIKE